MIVQRKMKDPHPERLSTIILILKKSPSEILSIISLKNLSEIYAEIPTAIKTFKVTSTFLWQVFGCFLINSCESTFIDISCNFLGILFNFVGNSIGYFFLNYIINPLRNALSNFLAKFYVYFFTKNLSTGPLIFTLGIPTLVHFRGSHKKIFGNILGNFLGDSFDNINGDSLDIFV